MKFTTNKIWQLYFALSLLVLIICLIFKDRTIDFQRHDTYYVITIFHLGLVVAFSNFLIGIIYLIFRRVLSIKILTVLHFGVSVLIISTMLYFCIFRNSELLNDKSWEGILLYRRNQRYIYVFIIFWILSNSLLLINIFMSLLAKISRKKDSRFMENNILDTNENE